MRLRRYDRVLFTTGCSVAFRRREKKIDVQTPLRYGQPVGNTIDGYAHSRCLNFLTSNRAYLAIMKKKLQKDIDERKRLSVDDF